MLILVVVMLAVVAGWAVPVSALTIVRPGMTNQDEHVYVGRATRLTVDAMWACYDNQATGIGPFWKKIGDAANGLNDDYQIHGDSADVSTGNDQLMVISATTKITGDCAADDGGSWTGLKYHGHYLDLYGDGGDDDWIHDGGGSHDTWVNGGAGKDYVVQASSIGRAHGNAGDDVVWGDSAGSSDYLYGDAGGDCLFDTTNTWAVFDCGGGPDHDVVAPGTPLGSTVGCDEKSTYCGLF